MGGDEGLEDSTPVVEGYCAECDEEAVEVDPSDVIKVVDDNDVEPIDVDVEVEGDGSEEEESTQISELRSEISELKDLIKGLAGKQEAVFEAAGLFGDFTNKEVEGKDPKVNNGAQHKDFQKKIEPKVSLGDKVKLGDLRTLADKPKKVEAGEEIWREDDKETESKGDKFTKDKRDVGKSKTAPESGYEKAVHLNTPKKAPAQKEISIEEKQAVASVLAEAKAKSFLEEARKIIRKGK